MHDATGFRRLTLLAAAIAVTSGVNLRLVAARAPAELDPALVAGLTWHCIGPFDGGPVASVSGVAGVPGTYTITTPTHSTWKTTDSGGTWTAVDAASVAPSGDPHQWVDPANPRRMVRTEPMGIAVTLDAGQTWTSAHHLPIADIETLTPREHPTEPKARRTIAGVPVNVSIVDPVRAQLVFAGTDRAVYVSVDGGTAWTSLRLNMPEVPITDLDVRGHDLVAATRGRAIWTLSDISPLRQMTDATAVAPAVLFAPADGALISVETSATSVSLDYCLGRGASSPVTLEVLDAAGRAVRTWRSGPSDDTDRWLALDSPIEATPGEHRVQWTMRFDPPPSPHHRFAHLAKPLFQHLPADPDGPRVLPGAYRVRLTAGAATYTQPLTIRGTAGVTPSVDERAQFAFEMKAYDALGVAHRGFLQLSHLRAELKPLLATPDQDLAALLTDLDTRLAAIDGSTWTGLVIPDADNDASEADEDAKEGKHPDFVPPKAVSLSKDYDDPTSVLGRNFANVDPPPAFAIVGTQVGEALTRVSAASAAPDQLAIDNYGVSCQQLATALETWRAVNTQELPALNVELAKRHLSAVTVTPAARVPTITCAAKRP